MVSINREETGSCLPSRFMSALWAGLITSSTVISFTYLAATFDARIA
jgi:hypothetical protein